MTPMSITKRPAHAVDVYTGGDDLAALEAAVNVRKLARSKGLPDPVRTAVVGDRIEVALLWPHLLLWFDVLDGLGQAAVDDGYQQGYQQGGDRRQVVPGHRDGDYSVHGWTDVLDGDAHRRQQWVLRPVTEHGCTRCADLPEPRRQPLSVEAWFEQRWFELTGRRWDQPAAAGR